VMRIYLGQTRSRALARRLWRLGIGECTVRGELPPVRRPWFYDNGAYGDWTAKRPFDVDQFVSDVRSMHDAIDRPEFIVLPDIVAGGLASLEASRSWIPRVRGLAPLYLAVQDGMDVGDVEPLLPKINGLFVGGSLKWKVRHGAKWVREAHARGKPCHIGRVGTFTRTRWALRIGADSIDSCFPLFTEENMQQFLAALEPDAEDRLPQTRMKFQGAA
jgi:hypothetical protein